MIYSFGCSLNCIVNELSGKKQNIFVLHHPFRNPITFVLHACIHSIKSGSSCYIILQCVKDSLLDLTKSRYLARKKVMFSIR